MPGMMDTILNLGMNDTTVDIIAAKSGNPKFAWDSYRRFLQMYGDVVMGVQKRPEEDHERPAHGPKPIVARLSATDACRRPPSRACCRPPGSAGCGD